MFSFHSLYSTYIWFLYKILKQWPLSKTSRPLTVKIVPVLDGGIPWYPFRTKSTSSVDMRVQRLLFRFYILQWPLEVRSDLPKLWKSRTTWITPSSVFQLHSQLLPELEYTTVVWWRNVKQVKTQHSLQARPQYFHLEKARIWLKLLTPMATLISLCRNYRTLSSDHRRRVFPRSGWHLGLQSYYQLVDLNKTEWWSSETKGKKICFLFCT